MFPRNDLSFGRLAADGRCADAIVFARYVPLAQSSGQALCSCTLGACVCINRYPSPSGRPDPFRVRPFSLCGLRRIYADAGCGVGSTFQVFAQVCGGAHTRSLIRGGTTKISNASFGPQWRSRPPLRAACRGVASPRPARLLAAVLAPLRATQVCATDKPALTVRGRGLSELRANGTKTPGALAFA